jgi:hypothetical protein
MKQIAPIVACIAALVLAPLVNGEDDGEPDRSIPLKRVWAYNMPGTKSVRELEPKVEVKELSVDALLRDSVVLQIYHSLLNRPKDDLIAGPAFIVEGTDKRALQNAASVLTKGKEPLRVFPADSDLTLVFYSFACGRYVWIDSIELSENRVTIYYRFVSHANAEMTAQFALIPLGKLQSGVVQVSIERLPTISLQPKMAAVEENPVLDQRVGGSFSFRVRE